MGSSRGTSRSRSDLSPDENSPTVKGFNRESLFSIRDGVILRCVGRHEISGGERVEEEGTPRV